MSLTLYVMINTDLKMGKGKIAGQVGHAVEEVILHMLKYQPSLYIFYQFSGRKKVVLKSNEVEMKSMLEKYGYKFPSKDKEGIWCVSVYDAGITQIPSCSLTAVGFGVMQKDKAPEEVKQAKLL